MDRKEFLALVGASPFAFKQLAVQGKPIPKKSRFSDITTNKLLLKHGEKEVGILSGFELSLHRDIIPLETSGGFVDNLLGDLKWDISYEGTVNNIAEFGQLRKFFLGRDYLYAEIYYPKWKTFLEGKCVINALNYELSEGNMVECEIEGIGELKKTAYA